MIGGGRMRSEAKGMCVPTEYMDGVSMAWKRRWIIWVLCTLNLAPYFNYIDIPLPKKWKQNHETIEPDLPNRQAIPSLATHLLVKVIKFPTLLASRV